VICYIDENIPIKAAQILDAFDGQNEIRSLLDWFERGTPDIEWMKKITLWDKSPVVISGDSRILTNKAEKQILKECNLMYVLVAQGWLHLEWPRFAWRIIKIWPSIVTNVKQARCPMIFKVPVSGLKIENIGRISNL